MKALPKMLPLDLRNIKNQVGCGYCMYELCCAIKQRDVNFAKAGCPCYTHWSNLVHHGEPYSNSLVIKFLENDT